MVVVLIPFGLAAVLNSGILVVEVLKPTTDTAQQLVIYKPRQIVNNRLACHLVTAKSYGKCPDLCRHVL